MKTNSIEKVIADIRESLAKNGCLKTARAINNYEGLHPLEKKMIFSIFDYIVATEYHKTKYNRALCPAINAQ